MGLFDTGSECLHVGLRVGFDRCRANHESFDIGLKEVYMVVHIRR